ncbi:hypothetical protein [Arthrobacter sp. CJ23]|uniref:hypothetical protein n=1 Tax=Arthrobacter sp. CJ23 TaxID=2972479 RepID=UPI00215C2FFD|nr:hypothetical protein [Arthrobacter sp. CJ23]UVJ40372.1 hypothetical protein NVV90_04110 [Arthrobacter sp. CJ23]
MESSARDQPLRNTVTLVRWSRNPGKDPMIKFVVFSILGLILGLILMLFMPGLRNAGAVALFTALFAAILTIPAVNGQRNVMRGLTKKVNDTILEVTGSSADQLSVRDFRQRAKSGEQLPLLVNGVPGLHLQVKRTPSLENDALENWFVVFSVIPPKNGTASFDRLLAAALDARPEAAGSS